MGIIIGLIAALLKQSITALGNVQWNQTKSYLQVKTKSVMMFSEHSLQHCASALEMIGNLNLNDRINVLRSVIRTNF